MLTEKRSGALNCGRTFVVIANDGISVLPAGMPGAATATLADISGSCTTRDGPLTATLTAALVSCSISGGLLTETAAKAGLLTKTGPGAKAEADTKVGLPTKTGPGTPQPAEIHVACAGATPKANAASAAMNISEAFMNLLVKKKLISFHYS
jgi:hypothetical protein